MFFAGTYISSAANAAPRSTHMAHKILRLPAVKAITGKSRTGIYNDMNRKTFPQSVPIGERAVGWLESDIEQWLNERVEKRRAA
jgi:prophage regulatory protein